MLGRDSGLVLRTAFAGARLVISLVTVRMRVGVTGAALGGGHWPCGGGAPPIKRGKLLSRTFIETIKFPESPLCS